MLALENYGEAQFRCTPGWACCLTASILLGEARHAIWLVFMRVWTLLSMVFNRLLWWILERVGMLPINLPRDQARVGTACG